MNIPFHEHKLLNLFYEIDAEFIEKTGFGLDIEVILDVATNAA